MIRQQIQNNKNCPRYAMGQKYCSQCAIFIEWDKFHCPCCNLLLKTRSRHSKYKTEVKRIDWVSRPRDRDNSLHWSKKSQTKIIQINTLFWQVIMACNDQHNQYKATKPFGGMIYGDGQKYCSTCTVFVRWGGVRCPCCNYNLKYSQRNNRHNLVVQRI